MPLSYTYMLVGADELLQGEVGPRQYAARGKVSLHAGLRPQGEGTAELLVRINIKPGWHLNAHRVLDTDLIPTLISIDDAKQGWKLDEIVYPEGRLKKLDFAKGPLAVYEGGVDIRARLTRRAAADDRVIKILPVKISLQACSNKVCLLPETVTLMTSTAL